MCREVPEEFLRPESGWAIGAMSFSATGILVGVPRILLKINFLKFGDLKSFDCTLNRNNRILYFIARISYRSRLHLDLYRICFLRRKNR